MVSLLAVAALTTTLPEVVAVKFPLVNLIVIVWPGGSGPPSASDSVFRRAQRMANDGNAPGSQASLRMDMREADLAPDLELRPLALGEKALTRGFQGPGAGTRKTALGGT